MNKVDLVNLADQPSSFDLIIVGAGPAGLSAALAASDHGLRVAVIDEQHDIGGQIFRQPPRTFENAPPGAKNYRFAAPLLERARSRLDIDWYFGTTAWGVFHLPEGRGVQLAITRQAETAILHARSLLIATGAYDQPVVFPGWTLPGIMSAGGVQTMVKSQFVRPGMRFVLAGSHPLLLLVADLLVNAGANVLEVAIGRPQPRFRELLSRSSAAWSHPRIMGQTALALNNLRRHHVPVRFGTLIQRADGDERLRTVTVCQVDDEWCPKRGTERQIAIDTLVLGYGLLPSTELARQAGCNVEWQPSLGGWIVQHDPAMRTSVANIYVAGEPTGVKGAELAHLEGTIAGLSIVSDVRASFPDAQQTPPRTSAKLQTELQRAKRAMRRARTFADAVLSFFDPRLDPLAAVRTPDTEVCRCEEISAGTVLQFLADNPHVSDINSVKLACRTGMGLCQGRYCQNTVAHILSQVRKVPISELGVFTAQAPVKPVSVEDLAKLS